MGGIGLYHLCIVFVSAPRLFKHAQPRGFSGLGLATGIQIGWFNVAALGLLVGLSSLGWLRRDVGLCLEV